MLLEMSVCSGAILVDFKVPKERGTGSAVAIFAG
jgi:hypothetical protein